MSFRGARDAWLVVSAVVAVGCGSSKPSSSTAGADAGAACTDNIVNIFNNNQGAACPIDDNGHPLDYDETITHTCASQKLKSGDIRYGQCLDSLVWEVDVDSSGHNFTKCYYDVMAHQLVGVVYGDGMQDQCKGTSYTVQGGSVEPSCNFSGMSAGAGGSFQSCTPVADAGAD